MTSNTASTTPAVSAWLADLGALRLMLLGLGLMAAVFAPSPEAVIVYEGWGLVRTAVLPALGPIIFAVVLLDMLMTRVWMIDAEPEQRRGLRRVLRVEAVLVLVILLAWLPFILMLLERR